jgi:hypothetical protein
MIAVFPAFDAGYNGYAADYCLIEQSAMNMEVAGVGKGLIFDICGPRLSAEIRQR